MVLVFCVWLVLPLQAEEATVVEVQIDPPAISLQGPAARHTLLVTGKTTSGRLQDLGDIATF